MIISYLRNMGYTVIILGILSGILLATNDGMEILFKADFVWSIAIATWLFSTVVGFALIGLSELIEVSNSNKLSNDAILNVNKEILKELQKVKMGEPSVEKSNNNLSTVKTDTLINTFSEEPTLYENVSNNIEVAPELIEKVKRYLKNVETVYPTPFENIYLAKTDEGSKVIEYYRFMPAIISDMKINSINGLREWLETQVNS